jgi:glycine cleavage system H protein
MPAPSDLRYTENHEWIRIESDGTLSVGITEHAQEALGDIVQLELPKPGATVEGGSAIATIESVKTASDIHAPVSGEITSINESLVASPEVINTAPYDSWLFRIRPSDATNTSNWLSAADYDRNIGA